MKLREETWVQEVGLVGAADYFDTSEYIGKDKRMAPGKQAHLTGNVHAECKEIFRTN